MSVPAYNDPSPAEILRKFLINQAVVTLGGQGGAWPAYVSHMPDEVADNCVALHDTTPKRDGRLHRTGEVIEHPGVQVQVRAVDYRTGWGRIKLIQELLDALFMEVVDMAPADKFMLHSISRTGSILPLGQEPDTPKRRELFTLNVLLSFNPKPTQ